MKKFKKFFAVLLTLAMVLGMSMTSFAAEKSATITVNNAGKDATFKYLQIIVPDTTTSTGWAFANDDILADYQNVKFFSKLNEQDIIQAMIDGNVDAASIADALTNVKNSNYALKPTGSEHGVSSPFTVNSAGVYYIEGFEEGFDYNPMAGYVSFGPYDQETGVPTGLVNEEVTAKKVPNSVVKSDDQDLDVTEIGRTVTYTITSTVPYIADNETATYVIKDTITGATYVADKNNEKYIPVTVKIGKKYVQGWMGTLSEDGTSFELDLTDLLDRNDYANQEIVLTYQAVVTDVQVGNEVEVGIGDHKPLVDQESSFTGNITLTKYASDENNEDLDDNAKLAGAKFVVYKTVKNADGSSVEKYATFDEAGKLTDWVDTQAKATVVETGDNGTLNVKGLATGTYFFKEVEAPEGYSITEVDTEVALNIDEKDADGNATAVFAANGNMIDSELGALPSTGGIGTTIFTIGGCLIMIIAAGLFFASRRKANK